MKNNRKGFTIVETLLVIIVIGLIIAVGWLFYDRQNQSDADKTADMQQTAQSIEQKSTEKVYEALKKIDTTIHEVDISLKSEADLTKLPEYTPTSFKNYLADNLRNNTSYDNGEAIVTPTWKINKISQVNIQGGQVPTDKDGNGYVGGAPAIWVITPKGTWDQETLNGPVCVSKNGGKIYEEFVPICFDKPGTEGIKNPNGSINTVNN